MKSIPELQQYLQDEELTIDQDHSGVLSPEQTDIFLRDLLREDYFEDKVFWAEPDIIYQKRIKLRKKLLLMIDQTTPGSENYDSSVRIVTIFGGDRVEYMKQILNVPIEKCLDIIPVPIEVCAVDYNQRSSHDIERFASLGNMHNINTPFWNGLLTDPNYQTEYWYLLSYKE